MKKIFKKVAIVGLFLVSSMFTCRENVSAQISGPYRYMYTQQGQLVGLFCDPYMRCQWSILSVPNTYSRTNQDNFTEACRRAAYSAVAAQIFFGTYGEKGIAECNRRGFRPLVRRQYERSNRLLENNTRMINKALYGTYLGQP